MLWDTDEASTLHNHRDWMMCLFAVQKFGKIVLDPKNERFAFSQHDIYNPCENTHDQSTAQKKFFSWELLAQKKCTGCVAALMLLHSLGIRQMGDTSWTACKKTHDVSEDI